MDFLIMISAAAVIVGLVFYCRAFIAWGSRWGATPAECAARMTGDDFLAGAPQTRSPMTRAVSLRQPPEVVWPWLAQIGRGAGWYSYDLLDNGGKPSARHLVSWIPEPQLGDASAIGYLRYLEPGRELVWWVSGEHFLGARARMVFDIQLTPENRGSRLVIRITADAVGSTARLALWVFQLIDAIMARRQLLGLKERVESYGPRTHDPDNPETGRPDQYQASATLYASGQMAGAQGREAVRRWRQQAVADQVLRL